MRHFEKITQIKERMLKDAAFAREMKANPKAVFERELGKQLPEDFDHETVERTFPGFFHLAEVERPSLTANNTTHNIE